MTTNTNTPSTLGKRVRVTLTSHRYNGQLGTVVGESKKNYRVRVDGVKSVQTLGKPGTPAAGCKGVQGRRPKAN